MTINRQAGRTEGHDTRRPACQDCGITPSVEFRWRGDHGEHFHAHLCINCQTRRIVRTLKEDDP